jgi:hypothetical protein
VPADELDQAPGAERPAAAEKPAVAAKSEGQPEISPELQAELEEKLRAYNLKVALEEEEFRENYERENREADRRWEEYTARHRGG